MYIQKIDISGDFDPRPCGKGLCEHCGSDHGTVIGYSVPYAKELLKTLAREKRVDFDVPQAEADPRFSTDYLWGNARGQMFGVLVVRDQSGKSGLIKAFSGQYNGVWRIPGWVPPLVDVDLLRTSTFGVERYIKSLGRRIGGMDKSDARRAGLIEKRKKISQALMKDIHAMYRIPDCAGELKPLPEVVSGEGGIPSGTGDCCATKLIGYALKNKLTPLGLAEFYFGKENKSGSKRHGAMYRSCKEKCSRLLGYMLCQDKCRI